MRKPYVIGSQCGDLRMTSPMRNPHRDMLVERKHQETLPKQARVSPQISSAGFPRICGKAVILSNEPVEVYYFWSNSMLQAIPVQMTAKTKKAKKKKASSAKKQERQAKKNERRIQQFNQCKAAEQLAIGMIERNARIQQLGHTVKEEELVMIKNVSEMTQTALWAAQNAYDPLAYDPENEASYGYPSRSPSPQRSPQRRTVVVLSEQDRARQVEDSTRYVARMRAHELARVTKANDFLRARRARAVFEKSRK